MVKTPVGKISADLVPVDIRVFHQKNLHGNTPVWSLAADWGLRKMTSGKRKDMYGQMGNCQPPVSALRRLFYLDCQRLGLRLPWKQAITTIRRS